MKNTPLIISIIALVGVIALGVMSLTGKKADTAGAEGTEAAATAEKGRRRSTRVSLPVQPLKSRARISRRGETISMNSLTRRIRKSLRSSRL